MRHLRSLTVVLAFAIALASILIVSPPVAATQNHPSWTQGDFWVYTRTQGSTTSTLRIDVHEKTSLTLAQGTYSVWHVTTTTTDANGNSVVVHSWVQESNLGNAKTNTSLGLFGVVQVTFDPPRAEAVFPLTVGATWSLNTTVRVVGQTFSLPIAYSGVVAAEQTTTVPAGSFSVAVISDPASGPPQQKNHYSESTGNHVRRESFANNGSRTTDDQLTAYRYQSGTLGLLLIGIGIAIVAVIAIAVFVTMRRRRARGPPQQPPSVPPPPP